MKKPIFLLILSLFLFFSHANAQETGIKFFEGTWQQAMDKAAKENKLIFMDCYTAWCPPCKELAAKVFTQKEIGDYYNTHFINVKMDMEKGEGKALRKEYGVSVYPTLLLLNPRGYKMEQVTGIKKPDTLVTWAKKVLDHTAKITFEERFDKGERAEELIYDYFTRLIQNNQTAKAQADLNKIVKKEGYDALYQKKYWGLLAIADIDSSVALYFVKYKDKFAKIYGEDEVSAKIAEMYTSYDVLGTLFYPLPIRKCKEEAYNNFINKIKERELPDAEFLISAVDFYIACKTFQFDKAYEIGNKALKDENAWQFYEMAKLANWALMQKEHRALTAKWAEKAASLTKDEIIKAESLNIAKDLSTLPCLPSFYPSPLGIGVKFLK